MMIVCVVVFFTTAATLYGLQITPTYTATALVVIEPQQGRVLNIEQVTSGLSADRETLATQINVVQSREHILQTIDDLDLLNDPGFLSERDGGNTARSVLGGILPMVAEWLPKEWLVAMGQAGEADLDVEPMSPEEIRETATRILKGGVNVYQWQAAASVLGIDYTSTDPVEAAKIANDLARVYVDRQLQGKRQITSKAKAWLRKRLQTLQDEVRTAEEAVEAFRASKKLVTVGQTNLSESRLLELDRELVRTETERAETEARLGLIRVLKSSGQSLDSISEMVASPIIAGLRQQEAALIREQAVLATDYGEQHPKMLALQQEKVDLAARVQEEMSRIIGSLENDLTVLESRQQNLREELEMAGAASSLENQVRVRLRELERTAEASRATYETLLSRFYETNEQEELLQPDARVIYPAEVPESPTSPSPKIFAAVGFAASTAFGCLLALLQEQMDGRLRSRRQVEAVLQVPCLSLVPKVRGSKPLHRYLHDKPRSSYAWSMHALYTATLMTEVDAAPKILLVTSALPNEGKTSLATSLAVLAAQLGKKTLLIDLDLWRPSIAREFGFQPTSGVAEVVTRHERLADALVFDNASGIDILAVRGSPADPTALLTSQGMNSLLCEVREQYDCVIIDSPPVLGVTDAQILSRYVDATIFAVRWERTKRNAATSGLDALKDGYANVVGAVLTQVNLKKHARHRYGDALQYYRHYRSYHVN